LNAAVREHRRIPGLRPLRFTSLRVASPRLVFFASMHTHSTTYDGSFCCNTAFLQQYSTNPFACVTRDVPSGGAIAAGLCRTKGAASLGGYNTQSGPARLQRLLRLGAPGLPQRARVHGRGAEAGPARSRTTSPRSTSSRSTCPQRATAAGACRTSSPRSREASIMLINLVWWLAMSFVTPIFGIEAYIDPDLCLVGCDTSEDSHRRRLSAGHSLAAVCCCRFWWAPNVIPRVFWG
jgi:hypothetical protein